MTQPIRISGKVENPDVVTLTCPTCHDETLHLIDEVCILEEAPECKKCQAPLSIAK